MTHRERTHMRHLLAVLRDPDRSDAEARSRARLQTTLILKLDAVRRVRREIVAAEARRANGEG